MTAKRSREAMERCNAAIQAADAYILALRQAIYSRRPEVVEKARAQLDELGTAWRESRDNYEPATLAMLTRAMRELLRLYWGGIPNQETRDLLRQWHGGEIPTMRGGD